MVGIFVATRVMMVAEQFWLVGLSLAAISLVLILLIREPRIKKLDKGNFQELEEDP